MSSPQICRHAEHTFRGDFLGSSSTVIDLGVNEGRFSYKMIDLYGCRVYGAEPVPDLHGGLSPLARLTVDNVAITGGETTVELHISPTRCASLLEGVAEAGSLAVQVRGETLHDFMQRHDVESVDLLKVDIEGAEFDMFDSLSDSDLMRIKQITLEYHDWLDASLVPKVAPVDARMAALGFQRIAFSLDNSDVLYLHPDVRLGLAQKAVVLVRRKYMPGINRVLRRRLRMSPPPA